MFFGLQKEELILSFLLGFQQCILMPENCLHSKKMMTHLCIFQKFCRSGFQNKRSPWILKWCIIKFRLSGVQKLMMNTKKKVFFYYKFYIKKSEKTNIRHTVWKLHKSLIKNSRLSLDNFLCENWNFQYMSHFREFLHTVYRCIRYFVRYVFLHSFLYDAITQIIQRAGNPS